MCKHILRVQFILIDGFQDDLSKKKNFPHIPVHAARPGRTDMLLFFSMDSMARIHELWAHDHVVCVHETEYGQLTESNTWNQAAQSENKSGQAVHRDLQNCVFFLQSFSVKPPKNSSEEGLTSWMCVPGSTPAMLGVSVHHFQSWRARFTGKRPKQRQTIFSWRVSFRLFSAQQRLEDGYRRHTSDTPCAQGGSAAFGWKKWVKKYHLPQDLAISWWRTLPLWRTQPVGKMRTRRDLSPWQETKLGGSTEPKLQERQPLPRKLCKRR